MSEPLIRKRTPAEQLAYIAARLREQPDATALIGHSLTLDMLAEELTAAESAPPPDRSLPLLKVIQAEGGLWTGVRAAAAIHRTEGYSVTPERGVQLMRRLVGRGQLVVANPPRGATFTLPFGPGGDVEYEWSTNQGGHADPDLLMVVPEELARSRRAEFPDLHPKLLRRTVTYGPWVEVVAEGEGAQ